jgi:uncharacterized protein YqfA (UPF0365 family)
MDYYRMKNIQADTNMRESISKGTTQSQSIKDKPKDKDKS